MLNKFLFRVIDNIVEPFKPLLVAADTGPRINSSEITVNVHRFSVCNGAPLSEQKRNINAHPNLHALDGIEHERPEPLVEHIQFHDFAEIGSILKFIEYGRASLALWICFDVPLSERVEIATQTVITKALKAQRGFVGICDQQSAFAKQCDLVGYRFKWLRVWNSHSGGKNMTDPCAFRVEESALLTSKLALFD